MKNETADDYTDDHDEQTDRPERRVARVGSDDNKPNQPDSSGPDRGGISVESTGPVRPYPEEGSEARDAHARVLTEEARLLEASWTGLLPHPADLERYNTILPGAADRFMRILEAETVDRSQRADMLAAAEVKSAITDRWAAICFLLIFTTLAVVFFALGNNVAGCSFLAPPILGIVKVMWPRRDKQGDTPGGEVAPVREEEG